MAGIHRARPTNSRTAEGQLPIMRARRPVGSGNTMLASSAARPPAIRRTAVLTSIMNGLACLLAAVIFVSTYCRADSAANRQSIVNESQGAKKCEADQRTAQVQ